MFAGLTWLAFHFGAVYLDFLDFFQPLKRKDVRGNHK